MTRALVTFKQASDHLKRDSDDDHADLNEKIDAASAIVLAYLKDASFLNDDDEVDLDDEGVPVGIPSQVKAATLYMLGVLYRDRDGEDMKTWLAGYPPSPVVAMLYPLRDPTIA